MLAAVLVVGVVEDALGFELPGWVSITTILLLLLFPYLLFRFTAAFRPMPRVLEIAAAVLVAVVMLTTAVQQTVEDQLSTPWLLLTLATWVGLSLAAVVRLWQAGRGQPTLARRRMHLMAGAIAALAAALTLVVPLGDQGSVGNLIVQSVALAAAIGFGLGFAPPQALRLSWRRREEQLLQSSYRTFMGATSITDVTDELLPQTAAIVGGSAAAIIDGEGRTVASHGDPANGDGPSQASDRVEVSLSEPFGSLVVWTSPYTPFFGEDELTLLEGLASVASLALERVTLLERDAAQRRELERAKHEAERANIAKTDFLSRMSHELRTPMNAVLGFGQLLEAEIDQPLHHEWVGHILKAGRHLLSLINDVLDLSRVESGRLAVSLEPVDVGELIRGALDLIRPVAEERSITITSDQAEPSVHIRTDRQRCTQVLLNLLSNAVKYNYDGGTVDIVTEAGDDVLRITVRDSGPGIAAEKLDQLFEPFERLGAETGSIEGTGLGLALSKNLAELMGGSLGFASTPGDGSRFWVEFPIIDGPPPTTDQPTTDRDAAEVDHEQEQRVLLIEDNLANLRLIETVLAHRRRVGVIPAMQGALGLDLARKHRPDLVLLDLHLPDIPGEQVLARLRADPRTKHIPVVIISADATPGRVRRLRQSGATDYLTKPLDLDRFLDVVDAALHTDTDHDQEDASRPGLEK